MVFFWHVLCMLMRGARLDHEIKLNKLPLSFSLANYSVFLLPGGGVPVPPLPIHWYYIMAAGGALLLLAVAILVRALCCCRQHLATKKSQLSVAYHSSSQCFQYSNWSSSMATPGVEPVLTVRLDSRDRHRTLCWKEALSDSRSTRFLVYSRKSDDDVGLCPEQWQFANCPFLHLRCIFACCFSISVPLKEFVVDISHHCCSSTEDLGVSVSYLFEQLVFGPLSAVWLLVMPTVLPENDPGVDGTHEACVGWGGAASQSCQTAD